MINKQSHYIIMSLPTREIKVGVYTYMVKMI